MTTSPGTAPSRVNTLPNNSPTTPVQNPQKTSYSHPRSRTLTELFNDCVKTVREGHFAVKTIIGTATLLGAGFGFAVGGPVGAGAGALAGLALSVAFVALVTLYSAFSTPPQG